MAETFDFNNALTNSIVGQPRTGKNKQFVFLQGEYAIKGPYQKVRLNNVISRSQVFTHWGTPCVVKAIDYFATDSGVFVRFPNIMNGYQLESEPYNETFSGLQYNILKNAPVIDVRAAIPANPWIFTEAEDVLVALCHCNILGVGDMNLRNTLVDPVKHQFYVIDFDDKLGKDRDDNVFYFNKPPAKKIQWYEHVSHHYNNVADRLNPLLTDKIVIDNNLVPRVQRAINLLRQFARTDALPAPKAKILLTFNPGALTGMNKPKTPPKFIGTVSPNINPVMPAPIVVPITTVTGKIGNMVWKGLRGGGTKTYSGVDFDVAKSAVQKYIRRNITNKAILAAIELYRLGEVGGDPGVTNMYNRLAIIANEDIGPANLPLVLKITKLVESKDRDLATLVTMVQLMCESNKTRMMSHAWRAYAHPEGRAYAIKIGLPVDTGFTDSDLKYIQDNMKSTLFMSTDPETIRPYILVFLKRLHEKDFNAFSWAHFFLESSKDLKLAKRKKFIQGNTRSTTGKADILLWKVLAEILPHETHDILIDAYYKHSESRPFLQNAILVALYGLPYKDLNIEPAIEFWRNQPLLQQMYNGDFTLEVDAYVIDKHTLKGRSMGMGIQEFVDEGAAVTPQDETYYNETLETIYRNRT